MPEAFGVRHFLIFAGFVGILLSAQVAYPVDIDFSWSPSMGNHVSGYRLFCRQDGEEFDYGKPAWEGSTTTCTIRGLDEGTKYFFVARAFNPSDEESDDSNQVGYPILENAPTDNENETADSDGDGMPDLWEDRYGLNRHEDDSRLDADGDLLDHLAEFENGTDPTVEDTDGDGLSDGLEVGYDFDPTDPGSRPDFPLLEFGELHINHRWTYVPFQSPFLDPVVVAKPLSYFGAQPAIVRIRNVGPNGFEICIQEWEYLNGSHKTESVDYLAVERGNYTLPDGGLVEAGRFETELLPSFERFHFSRPFQSPPIVVAGISSHNEHETVLGRIRDVDTRGFEFNLQEQEHGDPNHCVEAISYIGWEPSSGTINGVRFEVSKTDDVVRRAPHLIAFFHAYPKIPSFIADLQTAHGRDTANLRWKNKDAYGVEVFVDEEQSLDSETRHTTEVVGCMVFSTED